MSRSWMTFIEQSPQKTGSIYAAANEAGMNN